MDNTNTFVQKIKELTIDDIEYTEDFFKETFGGNVNEDQLRQTSREGHRGISHEYNDEDIDENWLETTAAIEDGQLSVDVFQTEDEIIIQSSVAGVRAEDMDVDLNGDMITIRGTKHNRFEQTDASDYFIKECSWGSFSRSIILPADIQHEHIKASLENGVLTIRLPKSTKPRNGKIMVEEQLV